MARKAAPKGAKNTKKKRKVSGARGSASRQQSSGVDPRGVAGIVILCIGLLALFSQFIPTGGGLLKQCTLLARGLGGTLCLLLPIMLCWAGVTLVFFSSGRMKLKTMICGALVFLFVETLLQLFELGGVTASLFADGQTPAYGTFLARSYKNASLDCRGGGLIGALLAWPLYCALDVWGAVIVLLFASVIVLMVFTGVSFSGVGMAMSEMIDDMRVSIGEKREERDALRQSREEEALKIEADLAKQRQKKRAEAEQKQARMRAQAEAKAEQERIAAQAETLQEEPPVKPARKGKGKPKLEVVRAQEELEIQEEMPLQRPSVKRTQAPRKQIPLREDRPLYIERDDEFTRDGIGERTDARDSVRRGRFTMQEAEDAFLYGIHAEERTAVDASGATQEEIRRIGQDAYHQSVRRAQRTDQPVSEPVYENVQPVQEAAYEPVYKPEHEPAYEDAYEPAYEPDAEPVYVADSGYADDAYADEPVEPENEDVPFWKAHPDAVIEHYEPEAEQNAFASSAPVMEEDEEEEEPYVPAYQPLRRERMRVMQTEEPESEGETPLQRSILAAQRAAEGNKPKVQDVLAAQEAAVRDQPIVQLRGTRPDGTPLVMPRKDAHEAPKILNDEYVYPPIDLLNRSASMKDPNQQAKIEAGSRKLLATLESFGVQAKLTHVTHGPAITRYELQPAPGVKVSRIVNLVDDIALNMASDGVRIEAPIPGKPAVGIEIPNEKTEMVSLRDVLESPEMMREKSPTAVALGKGISGAPVVADMAKMPHVLIAGATGSGKSVCINTIINSIIYRASPKDVRLILIDPKVVELSVYNGIPHLLVPVVTDPKKASAALSWAVVEMEHRYKRFETMGVRNIKGYNDAIGPDEEPMSKIIVIIDELADLMMVAPGEVEESICRLAQLARAAGIHLVIATQRPSVNVITGVIKANIPSRIAFAVSSQIDSRTILDAGGAEKLLGKGDMLYAPQGAGKPTRVQGCFVSDDEVQRIVDFVRGKHSADYNEDVMEQMNSAAEEEKSGGGDAPAGGEPVDEMLAKAIDLAVESGQVSISMLQRRLRVGYARAGRLVDEMTLRGITAEAEGPTKPRTVLISREEWRRMQENQE